MQINIAGLEDFIEKLEKIVVSKTCNMDTILIEPESDTPGCFAGFCSMILLPKKDWDFNQGRQIFSKLLLGKGASRTTLRQWTDDHPELWGNEHGDKMFAEPCAFGQNSNTFPATVLVEHLKGVLSRCKNKVT